MCDDVCVPHNGCTVRSMQSAVPHAATWRHARMCACTFRRSSHILGCSGGARRAKSLVNHVRAHPATSSARRRWCNMQHVGPRCMAERRAHVRPTPAELGVRAAARNSVQLEVRTNEPIRIHEPTALAGLAAFVFRPAAHVRAHIDASAAWLNWPQHGESVRIAHAPYNITRGAHHTTLPHGIQDACNVRRSRREHSARVAAALLLPTLSQRE
jgi:hypothetical protein